MDLREHWREPSSDRSRGVFGISVISELTGVGPQTLRLYEQRGLITPSRTSGGRRRYSYADLEVLTRITELVDAGVNVSGIKLILALEQTNLRLQEEHVELRSRAEVERRS
ncbi:MerR family transcriptional regulator [Prescottella equi]|uniref:MerR family transcriptional regulator n=1 Tax=Rhodococcus hoagii TaxID=43767 RepID=UPI0009BE79B0|nr:MerR family transcriptional regulator [Prescottella equi]OQQ29905.1 MerR family transcriptional regulator [Prescottella equi]